MFTPASVSKILNLHTQRGCCCPLWIPTIFDRSLNKSEDTTKDTERLLFEDYLFIGLGETKSLPCPQCVFRFRVISRVCLTHIEIHRIENQEGKPASETKKKKKKKGDKVTVGYSGGIWAGLPGVIVDIVQTIGGKVAIVQIDLMDRIESVPVPMEALS